jgi:uncharacterized protein involved in copper resistance
MQIPTTAVHVTQNATQEVAKSVSQVSATNAKTKQITICATSTANRSAKTLQMMPATAVPVAQSAQPMRCVVEKLASNSAQPIIVASVATSAVPTKRATKIHKTPPNLPVVAKKLEKNSAQAHVSN